MAKRKGTWGGKRAGAGRPRNPPVLVDDPQLDTVDPDKWLRAAMNSEAVPMKFRLKAAAYLRSRPIAPLEVADALYLQAMRGNVTAMKEFLRGSRSRRTSPNGGRKS